MQKPSRKLLSIALSVLMMLSVLTPAFTSYGAGVGIVIAGEDGVEITARQEIQEYGTAQLSYVTSGDVPEGAYVQWVSNLPLLAGVDDNGKVTGYDYSKSAIIQLWLDENIRVLPLVGDSMADSILKTLTDTGINLDNMNNDLIVSLVRGIVGDTLADSLQAALDNMNVEITATLYAADGSQLAKDTVEFVVSKSIVASVVPTGTHITNKKSVPLKVAVGTTVQLYAAVTPVRLKHGVTWAMGSTAFDLSSAKYASVSSDGLVTFTAAGTTTVRAYDTSNILFMDTITFTVVDPSELPVETFDIAGTASVSEGDTTQLAITNVVPAGAYTGDLAWSVEDPSIAVIDQNGIVTGLDGGTSLVEYSKTTTVTATAGGVSKSVSLKVTRSGVTGNLSSVSIDGPDAIATGSVEKYTANVLPARLNTNSSVVREWGIIDSVSGETLWATDSAPAANMLASVDSRGNVTAHIGGLITLTSRATYNNGTVETQKNITIGKAITDFSISGSTDVFEGSTTQLTITGISPADYEEAILHTAVWSSADTSVASVTQDGLVRGLDCGGNLAWHNQSTTITVTIGGVTKSVTVKVKNKVLNSYTGGEIVGSDYVIKDFPYAYTSIHTPDRISVTRQFWGIVTDDGSAPWSASNTMGSVGSFSGNTSNSIASVDQSTGVVSGNAAGTTVLHTYIANLLTTHLNITREITVVELEPRSIAITPPVKVDYVEGSTELDLSGMEVKLTYDREDIAAYYGDDIANAYTEEQLTVAVTDYTVSEVNTTILDTTQYILVKVTRAGRDYHAVFPVVVASKAVESIELENPQYKYVQGATNLDLSALRVKANYSNAESEYVTGYDVDVRAFDPNLFDTEQNITVTYTHAGRSASASFPVIVYGIPQVSVDMGGYDGSWTNTDVTLSLSATHALDGVTYYYKTATDQTPAQLTGNMFTVSANSENIYYFKAVNSEGVESGYTKGYAVRRDDVTPSFDLTQAVTDLTNHSYAVSLENVAIGASGIAGVTLNGTDITNAYTAFTVDENGDYTVTVTANNGLSATRTVTVSNIDKQAPAVSKIQLENKNGGGFARLLNGITFGKFFNQTIEITITAADAGVAGIDRVEYRFLNEDGLPEGNDWQVYDASAKPEQDPNFKGYVEVRAVDKAGNVSEILCSDGYVIDGDAPADLAMNATYNGEAYTPGTWVAGDVTIQVSSSAFSGIYEYRYRVDGGKWQSLSGDTFTATLEGEHHYEFKAISNAALDSMVSAITVKIDRQTPVIRVSFEGTFGRWSSDGAAFRFSTESESLSGITYYYDNGNGWTEITSGAEINLTESVNAIYRFKAVNAAGTESYPSDSYHVMIDSTAPEIILTPETTAPVCVPYAVAVAVVTGESGLQSVTMNGADITGQDAVVLSQNGTYVFVATGINGKVSVKVLTVDNFYTPVLEVTDITLCNSTENSAPVRTDDAFGVYYKEAAKIAITAQNTGVTGVAGIEYRLLNENMTAVTPWQTYNAENAPEVQPNFRGYIEARAFDSAENKSEPFVSEGFTVDGTAPAAPVVAAQAGNAVYTEGSWTNNAVEIVLQSSAFSGISAYLYSVDGGVWQTVSGSNLTLPKYSGMHTWSFKAVSGSAHESAVTTFVTCIDDSTPILQVGINGAIGVKTDRNITFELSAPNAVSDITYYYDNGNGWTAMDSHILTISETITAAYRFKAVNAAGVESYVSPAYHVILDKQELTQLIPKEDGSTTLVIDRTNPGQACLAGVNAGNTTVAQLCAELENESVQIVVLRDGRVLGDTEKLGTGCVVQCVSVADPAVVYDSATVILYGDVNGDGAIDDVDYALMMQAAVFGNSAAVGEGVFHTAADLNGDGVIDAFDYAILDMQLSGLKPIDQTGSSF